MPQHQKISQKINRFLCCLLLMMFCGSELRADVNGDEDETFYVVTIDGNFQKFLKEHHRYPRSWIELGVKDACTGGEYALPKRDEGLIWRPDKCEMSYQLVYSNKKAFKVAALKNGHVVSVFENYKATYFKTPYHSHEPAVCPENIAC